MSSHHHKLSTYDTIKLSLAFCILWFLANYTTNASLAYTTVGSSTILASMSGKKINNNFDMYLFVLNYYL